MKKQGIEYRMSKKMFDALLKDRSEEEKKNNPYAFILKVINQQFGIKGTVTHISIFD